VAFTRRLRVLAGDAADDVLQGIQSNLMEDPARGYMIQGLGGIQKARLGNPRRGKGKRGGYRYFYLYLAHKEHIHLLLLLDKDEQEDLTPEERATVRAMVTAIKQEA